MGKTDLKPNIHPSLRPFKCPLCRSPYFGPIFKDGVHVGRFCKGWPSGHDRSYIACKGKHEEKFDFGRSPNGEKS